MTSRANVVACARSWVGVPFRHQGTTRRGVDCIGLIGGVASELGITDVWLTAESAPFKGYGVIPDSNKIYRACAEYLDPVFPKERAQPGDILLIRLHENPVHFAILTAAESDRMFIVHALANTEKVSEHRVNAAWRERLVCAYSYRGLD